MAYEPVYVELYEVRGYVLPGDVDGLRKRYCHARFQMIMLGTYKQIRATRFDVLSDVDEDGYERAFATIRPSMCLH